MTAPSIASTVRAVKRLSPSTVRAIDLISPLYFLSYAIVVLIIAQIEQLSKLGGARRCNSTGTEPPPAGGHLPSVATSKILRSTREAALRTPGIKWLDEDGISPLQNTIGGRETRKMNLYQAVRDAMGCANSAHML